MKEEELVVKDPRLEPGFPGVRRSKSGKVTEFAELKYDVRLLKFVLLPTNAHTRPLVRRTLRRPATTHLHPRH